MQSVTSKKSSSEYKGHTKVIYSSSWHSYLHFDRELHFMCIWNVRNITIYIYIFLNRYASSCVFKRIWEFFILRCNSPHLAQVASLLMSLDHTQTDTRWVSSRSVIGPSHRPLPTQHTTNWTNEHLGPQRYSNLRSGQSTDPRRKP